MSKEFSELNGYGVKDAVAREEIEALKEGGGGGTLYKVVVNLSSTDNDFGYNIKKDFWARLECVSTKEINVTSEEVGTEAAYKAIRDNLLVSGPCVGRVNGKTSADASVNGLAYLTFAGIGQQMTLICVGGVKTDPSFCFVESITLGWQNSLTISAVSTKI